METETQTPDTRHNALGEGCPRNVPGCSPAYLCDGCCTALIEATREDDEKCDECRDWIGDYMCPNDRTLCVFCCPCHTEDLEPIGDTPITRRIAGLTITCDADDCDRTATHRAESTAEVGYAVHWTCDEHTVTVPTNAARAVDRFNPNGPRGYRSSHSPGAPLRSTRQDAERDWLAAWHDLPSRNVAGDPLIGCTECGGLIFDSHHDGLCGACRPA